MQDAKVLRSAVASLFFAAWLINLVLHVPSFYRTSFSGDEDVFVYLSSAMGWDQSNYSTADNPSISEWPNSIYRQPVFHHGPALPYVMKLGSSYVDPQTAAFIFANFAMGMFFCHLWVIYRRLRVPPGWQVFGFFAAAVAPLLLFSTTRVHHDGTGGIFVACALVAYVEALERKSSGWALWSGLLTAIALNLQYSSLASLPLFGLCQLFYCFAITRPSGGEAQTRASKRGVFAFEHWKVFVIVMAIVITLGLQHYYRLFAAYGSIIPWDFMQKDVTDPWYQSLHARTRHMNAVHLVLLIPLLLVFLMPRTWSSIRDGFVRREWGAVFVTAAFFLLLVRFAVSYNELRRFAAMTPLFYCCLPWLLARSKPKQLPLVLGLAAISLFLMFAVGYREVGIRPNNVYPIIPVLYDLVPALREYW